MKSLKNDFSLMSSLLIPVAVAINFTGFGLVKLLQVPIFLDSIGTVFISLIAGPWVGVVTAVITSLITGSFSPEYFALKDFTLALEKKGLNPKAAFILMLTLQTIPEMKKQADVIMDSQKARGIETEGNVFVRAKALIPIFIPLVLSSIANTEERAITLEARGFSVGEKRTILYDIKETKNDKIMKVILAIFIVLSIVWRVLWAILN